MCVATLEQGATSGARLTQTALAPYPIQAKEIDGGAREWSVAGDEEAGGSDGTTTCRTTSPLDARGNAMDITASDVAWQAQVQRALWGAASDELWCAWLPDRPACPNAQAAASTASET